MSGRYEIIAVCRWASARHFTILVVPSRNVTIASSARFDRFWRHLPPIQLAWIRLFQTPLSVTLNPSTYFKKPFLNFFLAVHPGIFDSIAFNYRTVFLVSIGSDRDWHPVLIAPPLFSCQFIAPGGFVCSSLRRVLRLCERKWRKPDAAGIRRY